MRSVMFVVVALAATAAPAWAADGGSTRDVAAELAKKVREVAGGLKPAQTAVRIGLFTGSQDLLAVGGSGGGFMAELEVALAGFVNPAAPLELKGDVLYVDDPDKPGLKVIKVKARLVDNNGDQPVEFREFVGYVRKVTDIARMTGPTVSFSVFDDEQNKEIQKALPPAPGKPPAVQAVIDGTFVRAGKDSLYMIEVRKKPLAAAGAAKPQPAALKGGLPFVPIDKSEVYEVRVLNYAPHEIAVSLAIDGIDQFTFSDDRTPVLKDKLGPDGKAVKVPVEGPDGKPVTRPRFSHWFVGPAAAGKPGEVLIVGWHKTADPKRKDNALSFLVTEYGKGAASQFPTQAQGKVGTITVGFAMTYQNDDILVGGPDGPKIETGFGPPRKVKQTVVERKIAAPHEFVTIRYNR